MFLVLAEHFLAGAFPLFLLSCRWSFLGLCCWQFMMLLFHKVLGHVCLPPNLAVGKNVNISSLVSGTPLHCEKSLIAAFSWYVLLNTFSKGTIHCEFFFFFSVPVWCGHLLSVKVSHIHSLYFRCCLWLTFSGNYDLFLEVVVCFALNNLSWNFLNFRYENNVIK